MAKFIMAMVIVLCAGCGPEPKIGKDDKICNDAVASVTNATMCTVYDTKRIKQNRNSDLYDTVIDSITPDCRYEFAIAKALDFDEVRLLRIHIREPECGIRCDWTKSRQEHICDAPFVLLYREYEKAGVIRDLKLKFGDAHTRRKIEQLPTPSNTSPPLQ